MTYVLTDRKVFTERGLIFGRNWGTKKNSLVKKISLLLYWKNGGQINFGGQWVDK
jgi:hypothetical protein